MAAPPGCSPTAVPELGHGAAVRAQQTLGTDRWGTTKRQGQGEMQPVHPLGAGARWLGVPGEAQQGN